MTAAKQVRAQYTHEFKLEAVRQVNPVQVIAVAAKVSGIPRPVCVAGFARQPNGC